MSDTLYRYYEDELASFQQESREFAERYPSAAGRLQIDQGQTADPHVERLIQSFSFLNARIRKKLDDDFPELTDALLSILYPHFMAPIPAMTTLQFHGEPANLQATGMAIDRHSALHTQPVHGLPCKFRTCYPVELWPVEIENAQLVSAPFADDLDLPINAMAALKLQIKCTGGMRFEDLSLEKLRLHIDGDSRLVGKVHEMLLNRTIGVSVRATHDTTRKNQIHLDPEECLFPVGFAAEDAILPFPKNSFVGFQLLSELFSFPGKFAYVDLGGWQQVREAQLGNQVEVTFYLSEAQERLEREVNRNTFRLGCTPVVNLFERICEPIQLSHKDYRYKIVPDVHHPKGMEIYSVNTVKSADPHVDRDLKPFYSFHRPGRSNATEAYWFTTRTSSLIAGDLGTDVHLHLVDPDFDPHLPAEAALTVIATCTNRDLPLQLQSYHERLSFELESAIPLRGITNLQHVTSPLRAPMRRKAHWSLVSHLTLNHLSITDSDEGVESLRQMLRLYDFSDSNSNSKLTAVNRQMVEGILSVSNRRVTRRIGKADESAFCRGLEITLELDEEKYIGVGAFLFSCVMRHFFAKYASINSFTELLAKTKQREAPLRHWSPLLGAEHL